MDAIQIWNEMKMVALSTRMSLSQDEISQKRKMLAELYRKYLMSIPPENRNLCEGILVNGKLITIRRTDIPDLIMKDDFVFKHIINKLTAYYEQK